MNRLLRFSQACLLASAALFFTGAFPVAIANGEEVLLRDDFGQAGITVDPSVWRLPFDTEGTFAGRTQFRGDPATDLPDQGISEADANNGYLPSGYTPDGLVTEIHLDTFDAGDPGNRFSGTDLLTKRDFTRGGGLSFEGRARFSPGAVAAGVVSGLFLFDVSRDVPIVNGATATGPGRDEIDFELLGNQEAMTTQGIFTNYFDDVPFDGDNIQGTPATRPLDGFDLTEFNHYRAEWLPESRDGMGVLTAPAAIKWYVNDELVRVATDGVPNDPQKLHFNIWAPDAGFTQAFDAGLQPAATVGANQTFTAQLDYVEVSQINTTKSANLLSDPGFETSNIVGMGNYNVPAGTTTDEWFAFNNGFLALRDLAGTNPNLPDEGASPGSNVLGQTFGPFLGSTNASGFIQQVAASPGEEFEASASLLTPANDSILGTQNFTTLELAFVDASGNVIEAAPFVPLEGSTAPLVDGRDPNAVADEYVQGTAAAIAPAGTEFVRVTLLFVQLINGESDPVGDGGAAYFDDVSLVRLTADSREALPGDFNADGVVDTADFTVWRDNFGGDEETLNGAGDRMGVVDELDYVVWKSAFAGGSATLAAGVVPEPASLAIVLAGLSLAGRRRRRSS